MEEAVEAATRKEERAQAKAGNARARRALDKWAEEGLGDHRAVLAVFPGAHQGRGDVPGPGPQGDPQGHEALLRGGQSRAISPW